MRCIAVATLALASCPALADPGLDPPQPAVDRSRALDCMAAAIAYEAGSQSTEGQQAVGEVILNRLRNPIFPKTVCGVVFAGAERGTGCQFSFTCDGSLRRRLSDRTLAVARAVAAAVIDGGVPDRVFGATHYHADYVSPYWAPSLVRITRIGAHIFYRMPGAGDLALRVGATPTGEPVIAALAGFGGRTVVALAAPIAAATPAVFAPWGLTVAPVR